MPVFNFHWNDGPVREMVISEPYARNGGEAPRALPEVLESALQGAASLRGGSIKAPDAIEIDALADGEYGGGRIYSARGPR